MARLVTIFFIAFGTTLGGALFAGLAAVLTRQAPYELMKEVARDLKMWAVIAAVGGTFAALRGIEEGFLGGQPSSLVKQLFYLASALLGAQAAAAVLLAALGARDG
ncbi:MAG: YtrH family sporulation protein [Hydrogenibacillus sp.]|nr:YtrH family sporulation protein [Hydrogenibacillus sp.]